MWLEWMRHGAQPCGRNERARQGGGANPPTYGHAVSQHFALNDLQWRVGGKFVNGRAISLGRLLQQFARRRALLLRQRLFNAFLNGGLMRQKNGGANNGHAK